MNFNKMLLRAFYQRIENKLKFGESSLNANKRIHKIRSSIENMLGILNFLLLGHWVGHITMKSI